VFGKRFIARFFLVLSIRTEQQTTSKVKVTQKKILSFFDLLSLTIDWIKREGGKLLVIITLRSQDHRKKIDILEQSQSGIPRYVYNKLQRFLQGFNHFSA